MNEQNTAVDFNNPESLAAELAAADAPAEKTTTKKERKPRVIKVSFVADHDIAAGETVEFDYTVPAGNGTRGVLTGIALEDMTDDQLKIEYRNANSVAYKTKKAGRDSSAADARVERCVAEMDKRGIKPTGKSSTTVDAKSVAALIAAGKISVDDIQKFLDEAGN